MTKSYTLEKHPQDQMLYIRERWIDQFEPICHIYWHPTGMSSLAYCMSFGSDRLGASLAPASGQTFRFLTLPGAGHLSIASNITCDIQVYEKEAIPPPEIKERYRGAICPEWHEGKWMYYSYTRGRYDWRLILPGHLVRQSKQKVGKTNKSPDSIP